MAASKPKRRGSRLGIVDGTEMSVLQLNEDRDDDRVVGTIAMVTRDHVAAPTAMSMMMTDMSFLQPGERVQRYIVQGNVLVFQRNECINRMDGDWILFVDSDMVWQPGDIKTLVETREKFDLDMVGGLCFQRTPPYQPTMYMLGNKSALASGNTWSGYTFLEDWPEDAAVEVDATGMAFCLVHKRVFDRILIAETGEGFPDLETRSRMRPPPFFKWTGEFGEDFQFCREARAVGNRIFVDTSVKIGHIGSQTITAEHFYREITFRRDDEQAFREEQLESIGHKAITREQARERLVR